MLIRGAAWSCLEARVIVESKGKLAFPSGVR